MFKQMVFFLPLSSKNIKQIVKLKIKEEKAMTLLKRSNPYLPSFWDSFFSKDLMDWGTSNFSSTDTSLPAVNVKESEDAFEIEVAAPGMSKGDFKINLENNLLTISSEKKEEKKEEEKGRFTRREFSYQSFQRSFSVPETLVEADKIGAKYCDGILCIILPKKEEVKPKPAREIAIQ
jgi:HSP20 family protein